MMDKQQRNSSQSLYRDNDNDILFCLIITVLVYETSFSSYYFVPEACALPFLPVWSFGIVWWQVPDCSGIYTVLSFPMLAGRWTNLVAFRPQSILPM